ncbi:hypothetical protein I4U23_003985 [Adineta vaga]|nr:hypothetical protein I4U23_003985 [Adineta vaga]
MMSTTANQPLLDVVRSTRNSPVNVPCTAIAMLYLGPSMINFNGTYTFKIHTDEILILQSHTSTGTKSVFKGCLKPNDKFTFKSSRLVNRHFDITIYINGILDQHVSVCCEYGFVNQAHFHTRRSTCQLQSITGGIPCQTCHSLQLMNFFSNETHYEETNDIILSSDDLPTIMNAITNVTKDKQIEVPNTGPMKYDSIMNSNNPQAMPKQDEEMNTKGGINPQDEQPTENIKTSKDVIAELEPIDSSVNTKIMNEDNKTKISATASVEMQKLLFEYLKLFVPQLKTSTKNSQSNESTKPLITSDSTEEANRALRASMPYTGPISVPMSTIISTNESFVLIWLDETINKNQETADSVQNLRTIVNSLVTCREIIEATNIIQQIQDQEIYLIVSGKFARELLLTKEIIECSKLNSIYIFCNDEGKYTELMNQSNKIRGIFVTIDPLCERLKEDTKQALKNLLPISTTSEGSDDIKNQVEFLCSQLHRDLLFTMEYNNNAKIELAEYFEKTYVLEQNDLKIVDELKTKYHAGKAISWYTRQTILFKKLNEALWKQDIAILYKFHFFIKDLHVQLEQMHSLYKPSLASRFFTVHRGLTMTMDEFKMTIQVDKLIAFNSFLSTSLDEHVARRFALDRKPPKTESLVFYMEIDADQMERPFADISRWSKYEEEREVLFSIGTIFRIVDVAEKKTNEGIWNVRLVSVSEKDKQLKKETDQIQLTLLEFFKRVLDQLGTTNHYQNIPASNANVASTLYKQREFKDSLKFYEKALDALSKLESYDPLTEATYISNVAKVHMALGHGNEALGLYEKALAIRHDLCESNDPSLIHTLHTIGHIYREKKEWSKALEQFNQALTLLQSSTDSDVSSIAVTYICIGNIYYKQEKYQEALDAFLKALEQQRKHLLDHHPVLAFLYNNIGAMYYKTKQYDLALEHHLQCLKIELESLPSDHITFAETYKNIATTYEKLGRLDEARETTEKVIKCLLLSKKEEDDDDIQTQRTYLQNIEEILRMKNFLA